VTTASAGVLSAGEYADLASANAVFAQGCLSATGELYRHLSAKDSAADIERIRQALGQEDGLVAYSGSYGTLYGTAYLEQYGDHVKALVLDGVVDHSVDLATYGGRWARSTEDGFDRFVQWCNKDAACALHGEDVVAVYDEVALAHPEIKPVVRALLSAGSTDIGWPAIAQRLVAAAAGEPVSAAPGLEASPVPADPGLESGLLGQFRAVLCADYGPQDDYAALAADNAELTHQAPHFAWLFPQELPGSCVGWPWEATNRPHDLQVGPHPNVLVANGTHDPPTPLVAAAAVWSQIPQARLLIADADGHQVLPFSRCGFDAEVRFLTDPSSLDSTTYCPN
jgi:pimeloyl-ACP methyl ester carboxylesterase